MKDAPNQALSLLPHGPEFRFVDRMVSLDPGRSGEGEYKVRGSEIFMRGHFPNDPIFPGVLLAEAVAQLAGIVAQSDPMIRPMSGLRLAAMRSVKILGTARPGETLKIRAEVTGRLGNLVQAIGSVVVDTRTVLEAAVVLSGGTVSLSSNCKSDSGFQQEPV